MTTGTVRRRRGEVEEGRLERAGWRGQVGEGRLERAGWRGQVGEGRSERTGWRGQVGEGVWKVMKNLMRKDRRYSRMFQDGTYVVVVIVYSTPKDTT